MRDLGWTVGLRLWYNASMTNSPSGYFTDFMENSELVPTSVGAIRVRKIPSMMENGLIMFYVAVLPEDGGLKLSDGKTYVTTSDRFFSWTSSGIIIENTKGDTFPLKARKGSGKSLGPALAVWSEQGQEVEKAIFEAYISRGMSSILPWDVVYETKVHDLQVEKNQKFLQMKNEMTKAVEALTLKATELYEEHERMFPVNNGQGWAYWTRPLQPAITMKVSWH
jgi:hypothetical protein